MKTVRLQFDDIGYSWTKSGICPVCGKSAKRSKKFSQTRNPFNRGPDGCAKTVQQIHIENAAKAKLWQAEPTYHVKCEGDRK